MNTFLLCMIMKISYPWINLWQMTMFLSDGHFLEQQNYLFVTKLSICISLNWTWPMSAKQDLDNLKIHIVKNATGLNLQA